VLCTGWTRHLNVDMQGRVVKIPIDLRELLDVGE